MKKQIDPPTKAHLLWSALLVRLGGASFLCSKNLQLRLAAFRHKIMQPLGFPLIRLIPFGGVALGLAALAGASNLPQQSTTSPASLQPSAATHETQAGLQGLIDFPNANDLTPYTAAGSGGYSNVTTATTQATAGLIINPTFINPTFDDSIMSDPNSAAIEAMINQAIGIYESLFSDPITIQILFRYSDTAPDGTPLSPGVVSQSGSAIYTLPWNVFVNALRANATTSNDNTANASLPGSPLSANIAPSSANGRAVGLNTPPAMFPDGTIGLGGPYDGIVTLNSAIPFSFTRPLISGSFDAQRSIEHEIDEVIGLGSRVRPTTCESLFEAESPICPQSPQPGEQCSIVAGGAVIQSCPTCSGGAKVGFVGNNSGTLQFNGITANASGRLNVRIWYTNGDAVRYALLSVNGGPGTPLSFPSTGSFQTVGSIETTLNFLNPGSNNTITFYNPIVGDWAPDFDRIGVNCTNPLPTDVRPQDLFSWSSPGVRNLTTSGSRYFSIDSGSTNIVGFNQTSPGDLGDWLSEACPQSQPFVQNAFVCPGQFSDISATSPEGINLDVIGYDLVNAPTPTPSSTACSLLQQQLNRLQRRQQQLQQRHLSNRTLNKRIRQVRRQLQDQGCL